MHGYFSRLASRPGAPHIREADERITPCEGGIRDMAAVSAGEAPGDIADMQSLFRNPGALNTRDPRGEICVAHVSSEPTERWCGQAEFPNAALQGP